MDAEKPLYKAGYVVRGHQEKEKGRLEHTITTVRQISTRMLSAIAAVFRLRLWGHDITQAYLQSARKLMRDVYLKPSMELELSSEQLLKLLEPLYGLADSGDYWNETMAQHLENDWDMKRTAGDVSPFLRKV